MSISGHIEIGPDLRPCYVNGRRALFHTWVNDDQVFIMEPMFMKREIVEEKQEYLNKQAQRGYLTYLATNATVHNARRTFGLVEYENGKMERVDPTLIQFTDSLCYMADYHWPKPEELQHEET